MRTLHPATQRPRGRLALLVVLTLGCAERPVEPPQQAMPLAARAALDDTGFACVPGVTDLTLYRDSDDDGRGDPADPYVGCEPPPGYVAYPDDCDDTKPRAWSSAPELTCDGVDNDGDGFEPPCAARPIEEAASLIVEGSPGQDLRNAAWLGPDFTGDGAADLLLRQTDGSVQVLALAGHPAGARLPGHAEGRPSVLAPRSVLRGTSDHEGRLWWSTQGERRADRVATLRAPDSAEDLAVVTGHRGVADAAPGRLLVRTSTGAALLHALRGHLGADLAELQVVHATCAYDFGKHAEFAGDWDGDGVTDLLVGATQPGDCHEHGAQPFGALLSGTATGRFDVARDEGLLTLVQSVPGRRPGRVLRGVAPLGDVNGDGHVDQGLLHRQGLTLVHGPTFGHLPVDTAGDLTLAADLAGLADVREVLPLPGPDHTLLAVRFGWPAERNVVALFDGSGGDARALWLAQRFDSQTGITGMQAGDIDGDGQPELLVQAAADQPGSGAGRLYALPAAW